ncbi:TRAP transporter small permease [Noviherbaspirillum denitrificans]|uniref:TRAP transporter small permease n=1 Tax=Noviherbaspirillum denitrificans TaxID=1968433 RepID=UPI000B52A6F6|nr:TRAP transporter small permease [Noviherbaspirillum denitrificans]
MTTTLVDRTMKVIEVLIAAMLAAMVVLVFGNVVLRYGFNSGITISEEMSRYLFVWMTFFGAVIAVREHTHLGVDTLVRALSRRGKLYCAVASNLTMLFASALLFTGSWNQMLINAATSSPVAGISMSFLYLPGVIAGAGICVLIILHLYSILWGNVSEEELILSVESEDLSAFERSHKDFSHSEPAGTATHSARVQKVVAK